MHLKPNKKLLQKELIKSTGKIITLRDLSNIAALSKKVESRNDITTFVTTLKEKYNANVEVLLDSDSNLKGIFFQDDFMHSAYNSYPEFLCFDATYKLLQIRLSVYIILCEDSCGESEVAVVGLITNEDAASLSWFVETFKRNNCSWSKTNAIITDKDLNERDVLRASFPDASLLLCLFHTLR
ncbi:zinc finger SWIM domain-containing protein 1-like [Hydra vulgaris]|uniref:zinc finger SWIM domain-containing protein 1-like n=1 Tax=Hydra vulgaris TaxID=6087 RepID=UPI0032EA0F1D